MVTRRKKDTNHVCWNGIYPKSRATTESQAFKKLSFGAQVLYDVLCRLRYGLRNAEMDNSFWRSDAALMNDAGMTRNTLKGCRKQLVEGGFLIWQSHLDEKHREARYYVLDDVHTNGPDADALQKNRVAFGCDETDIL